MNKLFFVLGVMTVTIWGVLPGVALAEEGFSIGPAKLVVSVPENGSSPTHVYVTSYIDGELIVGTENMPFRVVPENVPISANDRMRMIELQVYGNPDVEAGEYSGKLTFKIRSDGNVAYGVKLEANVTQVVHPHSMLDRMMQGNKALVFIIIGALAAAVGIPLGLRIRRRKQLSN